MINRNFESEFFGYLRNLDRNIKLKPLRLGGIAGVDGGTGGPPGGFTGQLPQKRVTYDTTEAANSGTPASGQCLVHNLNHIRYRLAQLESNPASPLVVSEDGLVVASGVTLVNFDGDVTVNLDTATSVTVSISGGGGATGTTNQVARFSATDTVTGADDLTWDGTTLTIGKGIAGLDPIIKIDGETYDFTATWMEDEGWLKLQAFLLFDADYALYFRDENLGFYSSMTGEFDIMAGDMVNIQSPVLSIGWGAAGVDYELRFIGNTNTGSIFWRESDDYLDIQDTIKTAGHRVAVTTQTTDYTATYNDEVIVCDSDTPFVVTLLEAVGNGQKLSIKNINTGTITVSGSGGIDTIDGNLFVTLAQWERVTVVDYAANAWAII